MVQRMIEKNKKKKQKETGQIIKQTSNNQTSIKKKKQKKNKIKTKTKKSTNRNHPLMSTEIFETSCNMKLGLPRPGTESYRSD